MKRSPLSFERVRADHHDAKDAFKGHGRWQQDALARIKKLLKKRRRAGADLLQPATQSLHRGAGNLTVLKYQFEEFESKEANPTHVDNDCKS
jgi:hypothetical protein